MKDRNIPVYLNEGFVLESIKIILNRIKYILNESDRIYKNIYIVKKSIENKKNNIEVLNVLERASEDDVFVKNLLAHGTDALFEYNLTDEEKVAIITGDINWIENNIGKLTKKQKTWIFQKLTAEVW